MNLLVAAANRHPVIVLVAIVVAVCLVLYAVDAFLGAVEPDDEPWMAR